MQSTKDRKIPWSEEEENILRTYFPLEGLAVASRLPRRNKRSISSYAYRRLGLKVEQSDTRPWTEQELKILTEYYPLEGRKVSERLSGRNGQVCYRKAKELGLTTPVNRPWSDAELTIMKTCYNKLSMAQLMEKLPGRAESAIRKQASRMKLCAPPAEWTEAEDRVLLEHYPKESFAVANRLPGRTGVACQARYHKLVPASVRKMWQPEEDRILMEAYQNGTMDELKDRLKNRSSGACQQRLRALLHGAGAKVS